MVTCIRSLDILKYRYNVDNFCEKFILSMFIKMGRMSTTQGAHVKFVKTFLFLLFLPW